MVLDKVHYAVDAAVDGSAVVILAAEILTLRLLLVFRDVHGVLDKFVHAFVLRCGYGHHGYAEQPFHIVHTHGAAVALNFIHHIERQHHGDVQLQQLHGQIEVPFYIAGVDYVDYCPGLLLQDEIPGNYFLGGVGGKRIDSGKVGHQRILMATDHSVLAVDGDPGEVPHMLVRPRELVEQGGLAAVLVAGQGEGEHRPLGERVLVFPGMEAAFLSEAGMIVLIFYRSPGVGVHARRGVQFFYLDFSRVSKTQSQGITVDEQLHRIAERSELGQCQGLSGNDSHVKEMLPQLALSSDFHDYGRLAFSQFIQSHSSCN